MPAHLRNHVFVSYSHSDKKWRDLLLTYLAPLIRHRVLRVWSDKELKAGSGWEPEIRRAMERSSAAVLLVSADFLASPFTWDQEFSYFCHAAERGEVTMFWIAVSASSYKYTPLRSIQCLNDPDRPLDRMDRAKR